MRTQAGRPRQRFGITNVTVAPLPPGPLRVGPYCCAPTRSGLTVRFTDLRRTEPDAALHS